MRKVLIALVALAVIVTATCAVLVGFGMLYNETLKNSCTESVEGGAVVNTSLSDSGSLTVSGAKITQSQLKIATKIGKIVAGRPGDFPGALQRRVTEIAISTGIVESRLQNVRYGDRDSLGVFQQRPSQGWGTPEQVTNVTYATNKFLDVLLGVTGWQTMPKGNAAQAVQRSGFPDRYAEQMHEAEAITKALLGGGATVSTAVSVSLDCPDQDPIERAVQAALSYQGKPYDWEESPYTGSSLISEAFGQAGITLPSSLDKLSGFAGSGKSGVVAKWIPASDIRSGKVEPQRGDLVFSSSALGASSKQDAKRVSMFVGNGATGGGTDFRVASYNIHTGGGWQRRVAKAKQLLRDKQLDIVGFQESERESLFRALASKSFLGDTFAIYPKAADLNRFYRNGLNARAIVYNSKRFELVATDEITFQRMGRDDPLQPAHAPVLRLRDRASGQEFFVLNTHSPAYPRYAYERYLAGRAYVAKIEELRRTGLPVIFTGDFNSGFGVSNGANTTYQNKRATLTYCQLTTGGLMRNARDVLDGLAGPCPRRVRGSGSVDHIYVSSEVRVSGFGKITGTLSDHDAIYADVAIPGSGSVKKAPDGYVISATRVGATNQLNPFTSGRLVGLLRLTVSDIVNVSAETDGSWIFPIKKGSYHFNTNSYGPRRLGGDDFHNGTDFGTSGGTPPLRAMHSGTIVRSGYAGAWGNYLIVDTGVPVSKQKGQTYKYLYAHLSRYASGISVGGKVTTGQVVGNVGNTGNSFGEHLHLTICTDMTCTSGNKEGSVDPIPFLAALGIKP